DIQKLLISLRKLIERGASLLVIEHNLDVIKSADWVIDLGPEGGEGGGRIVATGSPEDIAAHGASWTGRFLAPLLRRERPARAAADAPRVAAGAHGLGVEARQR